MYKYAVTYFRPYIYGAKFIQLIQILVLHMFEKTKIPSDSVTPLKIRIGLQFGQLRKSFLDSTTPLNNFKFVKGTKRAKEIEKEDLYK